MSAIASKSSIPLALLTGFVVLFGCSREVSKPLIAETPVLAKPGARVVSTAIAPTPKDSTARTAPSSSGGRADTSRNGQGSGSGSGSNAGGSSGGGGGKRGQSNEAGEHTSDQSKIRTEATAEGTSSSTTSNNQSGSSGEPPAIESTNNSPLGKPASGKTPTTADDARTDAQHPAAPRGGHAENNATQDSATNTKRESGQPANVPAKKAGADAWGPAAKQVGELGVLRPTGEPIQVDLSQIDVLKLPEGDPRRAMLGIWEQVQGDNSPDFAYGDFSRNVITFRADGLIDVARFYGKTSTTRIDRQLKYTVEGRNLILSLRSTDSDTAKPVSLPLVADGVRITARAPSLSLPARVEWSVSGEMMTIGNRHFKRLSGVGK